MNSTRPGNTRKNHTSAQSTRGKSGKTNKKNKNTNRTKEKKRGKMKMKMTTRGKQANGK